MILNEQLAKDIIWQWVRNNSGLGDQNIIWGYQNTPLPKGTFIRLDIESLDQLYMNDGMYFNSTTNLNECSNIESIIIRIDCFNGNTLSTINKVKRSLNKSTVNEFLKANNISIYLDTDINDMSLFEGGDYTNRSFIKVNCEYAVLQTDDTNYIETTDFEFEIGI